MLFLVGINCSSNNAAVVAMDLFIVSTLTGRVSGGHFNAAVTFAVYLVEGKWKANLGKAFLIALTDLLGAYTAMFIAAYFVGPGGIYDLVPPKSADNPSAIPYLMIVEGFFTFILVSTVLFVKYRSVSSTNDGMLSNLTVALSLYVCVKMSGTLSGGGLNPTISTAIITCDLLFASIYDTTIHTDAIYLIAYIIGPLIGGGVAALLLKLTMKLAPE
jgi:glycerol uptake facilitator-like aquaporin